jgi:Fe(3+) dicitrate transport protein
MPAYTLMTAFAGLQAPLPQGWRLEFTVGVKNLLNQVWFTRTDDLNGGILAMRPRTFYLNLGFAHEFIRGRAGEQARRRPAKGPERRRQTASERRNQRLLQRMYGAWM